MAETPPIPVNVRVVVLEPLGYVVVDDAGSVESQVHARLEDALDLAAQWNADGPDLYRRPQDATRYAVAALVPVPLP